VRTAQAAGEARLSVIDNGPGFPPDILTRAFEPYVTTKSKGTGLGLAIVKKIVEEHNGSIEIANAPGGGAQVNILLPIADSASAAARVRSAPEPVKAHESDTGRRR
jgi:two-component system, NtrC family, nitrogen regulation sensor histidine kinase NtrY